MNLEASFPGKAQNGAALVIGLLFLLITTLIAVTAMGGVVMQERMAGNLRNANVALSGAESAVRAGEILLRELVSRGEQVVGSCDGTGPHRVFDRDNMDCAGAAIELVDRFRYDHEWTGGAGDLLHDYPQGLISDAQLSDPEAAGMAERPVYLLEHMGALLPGGGGEWNMTGGYDGTPPRVYRITGRSSGVSRTVTRVVESQFAAIVGGGSVCPDGSAPEPGEDCPEP